MEKYKEEIKEELSRNVEIEVDSYEETLDIAESQYEFGEIILDESDYKEFEICPYDNEINKSIKSRQPENKLGGN